MSILYSMSAIVPLCMSGTFYQKGTKSSTKYLNHLWCFHHAAKSLLVLGQKRMRNRRLSKLFSHLVSFFERTLKQECSAHIWCTELRHLSSRTVIEERGEDQSFFSLTTRMKWKPCTKFVQNKTATF